MITSNVVTIILDLTIFISSIIVIIYSIQFFNQYLRKRISNDYIGNFLEEFYELNEFENYDFIDEYEEYDFKSNKEHFMNRLRKKFNRRQITAISHNFDQIRLSDIENSKIDEVILKGYKKLFELYEEKPRENRNT